MTPAAVIVTAIGLTGTIAAICGVCNLIQMTLDAARRERRD